MTESAYIRQRDTTAEHGQKRDLSYPPLPEPLPVAVYDNHTHLEISDGEQPIDYHEHLERAAEVGIVLRVKRVEVNPHVGDALQ